MPQNYLYKGYCINIFHRRAEYNYSKVWWDCYWNDSGNIRLIASSNISLSDARKKVKKWIDEKEKGVERKSI